MTATRRQKTRDRALLSSSAGPCIDQTFETPRTPTFTLRSRLRVRVDRDHYHDINIQVPFRSPDQQITLSPNGTWKSKHVSSTTQGYLLTCFQLISFDPSGPHSRHRGPLALVPATNKRRENRARGEEDGGRLSLIDLESVSVSAFLRTDAGSECSPRESPPLIQEPQRTLSLIAPLTAAAAAVF